MIEELDEKPPGKIQTKQNIIYYIIRNIFTNRRRIRNSPLRINKQTSNKYNAVNVGILISFKYPWDNFIFNSSVANGISNKKQ